mmetsp:Transcript_27649/g.55583  ORF Transcript_27649/g.55583 Transcript_27649/m.55583 type:complete len:103 (-) Transcript_27649:151-459(-)
MHDSHMTTATARFTCRRRPCKKQIQRIGMLMSTEATSVLCLLRLLRLSCSKRRESCRSARLNFTIFLEEYFTAGVKWQLKVFPPDKQHIWSFLISKRRPTTS